MKRSDQKNQHSFSKVLISLMEEKRLGVREASRIAGVAPSTIVSWRSGALPEDYLAVRRLAQALGTTLSFVLTGESDFRPMGECPAISEVFEDDGPPLFDGFAKITVKKLIPKNQKNKKESQYEKE